MPHTVVMARPPASAEEARQVKDLAMSGDTSARIVLLSWQGQHASVIAQTVRCHPATIRARLHDFNAHGRTGFPAIPQEPYSRIMAPTDGDTQFTSAVQTARSRGVPNQLLHAYLQMNGEFPMAPAATDPAIGYEVVTAIARHGKPDSAETEAAWKSEGLDWIEYYFSGFSPAQIEVIGHTVTQIHLDAGIPIVTAQHLAAVATHPANGAKIAQLPAILVRDFLDAEQPFTPPHCAIQETAFGTLALVPLEIFQDGWNDIKERVFLAILNFLDAVPDVASRLTRPRQNALDGSPLTVENALRLAQFSAMPELEPYQNILLACYKTAYGTIIASADLGGAQHAEYCLTGTGKPAFRVTAPLLALIQRSAQTVLDAANAFPRSPDGVPRVPPAAVSGFINDITRRVNEPTN